jgi:hypothetical protein
MAGVVAGVAVMMIFATLVFQGWADVLRRDNEAEMIFRAQEIVRAIQRYRQDHGGAGPMKLEDLMEPGPKRQYYLRRFYKDPLVRGGKWGLLFIGPDGTVLDPSAPTPPGGDPFAGTSIFDNDQRSAPAGQTGQPSGPRQGSRLNSGGQNPFGQDTTAQERGARAIAAGNEQAGGLPIAGVKSLSTDKPFRFYKGLTTYAEWQFTFLDLEAQQLPGQRGARRGGPGGRSGMPRDRSREP